MSAHLLVAAHGTRSAAGQATTQALTSAIRAARPGVAVSLCFLDVAAPSLPDALGALGAADVIVVPLLLSAGYHVEVDIPRAVDGRARVRVARHLGPDPLVVAAVAERLAAARGRVPAASTVLAAVPSSREGAQSELAAAAHLLAARLGRPVSAIQWGSDAAAVLAAQPRPVEVAPYLLAEGGFLDQLRASGAEVVAKPIGVHSALVRLLWDRYDETAAARQVDSPRSTAR